MIFPFNLIYDPSARILGKRLQQAVNALVVDRGEAVGGHIEPLGDIQRLKELLHAHGIRGIGESHKILLQIQ